MLVKRIPQKIAAIVGLAPAPDFPKLLIWDKMTGNEKRKLVKNRKTSIKYEDGSKNDFSYKLIKDSFKNLTLSKIYLLMVLSTYTMVWLMMPFHTI